MGVTGFALNIRNVISLILCLISVSLFAQIKPADLVLYSHHFEIKENKLVGEGAHILKERADAAQFFMLGEQHNVAEISVFTDALLPLLAKDGYQNFVIETGKYSADRLTSEIRDTGNLYDFNTKYFELTGGIQIPFFDGKQDEIFLKTAMKSGLRLWGIDQEYYYAHLFLFDEIYALSRNRKGLKPFYEDAIYFAREEFKKANADDKYKMFTTLLRSQEVNLFFSKSKVGNPKNQQIVASILKSWEIYALYENKQYGLSNQSRMEYMKLNFGKAYQQMTTSTPFPKVFFKMGGAHLSYGLNSLGVYDIGNAVKELSYLNGTKTVSVVCSPRFEVAENGTLADNLYDSTDLRPVYENAVPDKWTLIDNQGIVDFYKKNKVKLSENQQTYLLKYDFILIPPVTHEMDLNYKIIDYP